MAWKIDKEYNPIQLDGFEDTNRVGTESLGPKLTGKTWRFRTSSDDMDLTYGGKFDKHAVDADAEMEETGSEVNGSLYQLWKWAMYDAGDVNLELHVKDAIELGYWSKDMQEKYKQKDNDWVSIFA